MSGTVGFGFGYSVPRENRAENAGTERSYPQASTLSALTSTVDSMANPKLWELAAHTVCDLGPIIEDPTLIAQSEAGEENQDARAAD